MERSSRKQKFEYSGKLAEYQLMARNTTIEYEVDKYTPYQNYLYKRALFGLNALTKEELEVMCTKKRHRINKVYQKGQQAINLYKQKLTIAYSNLVFKMFFPNSPITDFLLANEEVDPNFKNTLNFKDLKISKDDIISIFMEQGILPKNFLSLDKDPYQLPKLKCQK
jgi:hypothetical protein